MKHRARYIQITGLALLLITGLCWLVDAAGMEVVIIANPSVTVEKLDAADVEQIFTGLKTKLDDGSRITFAVLKEGEVHDSFLSQFVKKTASQFSAYWKKQVFTGQGSEPASFKSEEDLIAYVGKTAGAVGYCSASAPHDQVKTISVQ